MSSDSLDDLRHRIDEIDDRLHDLLMARAEIVETIAAQKRRGGVAVFRPGREAAILRRLVARHAGKFPPSAMVRMWREMLAGAVGLQAEFAVAVFVAEPGSGYWDLARDHFGSHSAMTPYHSTSQVIRAVTDGLATVGILPMPQEGDADPWWRAIVSSDESTPRILARLPFAGRGNARSEGGDALVVGSGALEPTGEDRSLVVVETRGDISRGRLFAEFAAAGLACTFFASIESGPGTNLNLLELGDFLAAEDPRLTSFRNHAGPAVERIVLLGGYAAPLALGNGVGAARAHRG
ncbi:MAG: chorismate mutase [Alphaproteobacteria bacterium]|nr:chorismate mutase [Alphaproteobacteria bacterium]